jgi:hypothetical protein
MVNRESEPQSPSMSRIRLYYDEDAKQSEFILVLPA